MSRLTALRWEKLVCVFEQLGYRHAGQKGSHIKMEKPGVARPLIIPKYDDVGRDIVTTLIRTAGITRDAFLALLDKC
jgi:predicted RNA binding protein YcfA (HicA-like mRNA interferase family)